MLASYKIGTKLVRSCLLKAVSSKMLSRKICGNCYYFYTVNTKKKKIRKGRKRKGWIVVM